MFQGWLCKHSTSSSKPNGRLCNVAFRIINALRPDDVSSQLSCHAQQSTSNVSLLMVTFPDLRAYHGVERGGESEGRAGSNTNNTTDALIITGIGILKETLLDTWRPIMLRCWSHQRQRKLYARNEARAYLGGVSPCPTS